MNCICGNYKKRITTNLIRNITVCGSCGRYPPKYKLPEIGTKLLGARTITCNGVKEWFDFPRYEVCGYHSDGDKFMVEILGRNGDRIGNIEIFAYDSKQFKEIPPEPSEEEKMLNELVEYLNEVSTSMRYAVGGNQLVAEELLRLGYRKEVSNES